MTNKRRIYLICVFILLITGIMFISNCMPSGNKTSSWANHMPASVIKNKPIFIFRADYKTEKDFEKAILLKILWLRKHEYKVYKMEIVPGKDMTGKKVSKFAVIYFEIKKENR